MPAALDDTGAAAAGAGVQVGGGKGVVVGDYNTVFQVFGAAPPSLSSALRVRDFKALVDERTRGFVGREFVFDAIDEILAGDDMPSGYVVVRGEPGIGKTALLGQLVKTRGYVHHFNSAPLGIRSAGTFLANVCAQVVLRYGLDHTVLPPEATADGGFLLRVLDEAAQDPANLPLVVVVDALDEAEDAGVASQANRLFLPPGLPQGVFFLMSTRTVYDYRLSVQPRKDVYVREDDPGNVADVRAYVERHLDAQDAALRPALEAAGVSRDEVVDVLTARSEGNFMYLVHVLRDLRTGAVPGFDLDGLQRLPQGLRDYYRRHWNVMRGLDAEHFRRYEEPVICLLATVREPVSVQDVLTWMRAYWQRLHWDADALDRRAVVDTLNAWREFLNTDDSEGRFRIYHASFQDFLKEEVGLTAYHEAIGEAALRKIPGFLPPV